MGAISSNKARSETGLFQSLLIFVIIAAAAALFVIVLAMIGFLPNGGQELSFTGRRRIVTVDFRFAQEEIRVKSGETVRVVLDNEDLLPHSFDVDAWDVHLAMPGNKAVTAEFAAGKPGVYTFYCGLPGHVEAGMIGTIIVEP